MVPGWGELVLWDPITGDQERVPVPENGYQDEEDLEWVTWACSYSSETGEWGDVSWIQDSAVDFRLHTTSVLVGDSLLYFMSDRGTIINIWSRVVSDNNDAALWVKSRVICLYNLLPDAALEEEEVRPMSFAERANVLFVRTRDIIFTIELQSERVRKVCEDDEDDDLEELKRAATSQTLSWMNDETLNRICLTGNL
ncbi:hypothetical protein ACQ4PT_056695 [Festuca glaucescens]